MNTEMYESRKIVCVIPSRYESSRFPGKPLADIYGKPMIVWVYEQCKKVASFDEIIVATDDSRIFDVCECYGMKCVMTSNKHPTHVHRVQEVSDGITADLYVVVCGDEPLIDPDVISKVIPDSSGYNKDFYVAGLCRFFSDPAEVIDPANIKIVTNEQDECIMLSRAPIPFPYKTVLFKYKKVVGVECYNKAALDFFVTKKKGYLESIEDITLQRFLENKIHIKYSMVETDSISVDTKRDLEKVKSIIKEKGLIKHE